MKNLYKILGIKKEASADEVKKAYFELAKKYHPDSTDESEVRKFYEVSEAYQILSDEGGRKAYNLTLGGGRIEKILVEEAPVHPTIYKNEENVDEDCRKKEMRSFKRKILFNGILKVIGFSLMMGFFGFILSFILEGILQIGFIAGFLIGFVWSVNGNFDLDSFIHSKRHLKVMKIIGFSLLVLSICYFLLSLIFRFF